MKHFKQSDFNDRNGRIWFHADKYATISGSVDCTFDVIDFVSSSSNVLNSSGDMVCTAEPFDASNKGHWGFSGDLDLELGLFDMAGDAVSFPPSIGSVSCTFLEPHLDISSGRGIYCLLQPMAFEAYSKYRSNDMDLVLKEFDMWAEGRNDFRSLEPNFEKMTLVMTAGSQLYLDAEKIDCNMHGVAGLTGRVNARMARPDMTMIGGPPPYIETEMENPGLVMSGNSDIVSNMSATMRLPTTLWYGKNGIVGVVSASMRPVNGAFSMGLYHPVGTISGTIGIPRCRMESIGVIDADIIGRVKQIKCEMQAFFDGINSVNAELPTPTIRMTSDTGIDGSCDLTDTLVFEE